MITQDELKQILFYNPATGEWTWLVRRSQRVLAGSRAGCLDKSTGYWVIVIRRKIYKAHRLAVLYMTGGWPVDKTDHENTARADNTWDNLRPASDRQNAQNRRLRSDNKLRLKGVHFHRGRSKYCAQIQVAGRQLTLGYYADPNEAHAAYCAAAKQHFGSFARGA
jgi:hypothetical protein